MKKLIAVVGFLGIILLTASAQQNPGSMPAGAAAKDDISGMYTFLQDGEFVQINAEESGITGFISRFGDLDSDRGSFLDHFINKGSLQDRKLRFSTRIVHGVWFDFKGTVERGEGKNPGDEAYYMLKGTLTQYTTDSNKKTSAKLREVTFKSFPQEAGEEAQQKDPRKKD